MLSVHPRPDHGRLVRMLDAAAGDPARPAGPADPTRPSPQPDTSAHPHVKHRALTYRRTPRPATPPKQDQDCGDPDPPLPEICGPCRHRRPKESEQVTAPN